MSQINMLDHVKIFREINDAIQNRDADYLNLTEDEKEYIFERFAIRFNQWVEVFRNGEKISLAKLKKSVQNWTKVLGVKNIKIEYDFYLYSWELYPQLDGELAYLFDASHEFHNRLARIFHTLGYWDKISNQIYQYAFQYAPRMRSLYYMRNWPPCKVVDEDFQLSRVNSLDCWFLCSCECMFYALGGYSHLTSFDIGAGIDSIKYSQSLQIMMEAVNNFFGTLAVVKNTITIFPASKRKLDENFRLHSEDSAAIVGWGNFKAYCFRGVRVPKDVILHPDKLKPIKIIRLRNVEVKRVMIERYGMDKFLSKIKHKIIHRTIDYNGEQQLIQFKMYESEPWMFVKVICPSTKNSYFLRVPPGMQSVKQAIAWTFGYETHEYKPIKET